MKSRSTYLPFLGLLFLGIALWVLSQGWTPQNAPRAGFFFQDGGVAYADEAADSRRRLRKLPLLSQTLLYIEQQYVDPERVKPQDMLESALNRLATQIAPVRVYYPKADTVKLMVDKKSTTLDRKVRHLYALHALVSDALWFVYKNIDNKDVASADQLETTAVEGILETLDPHSVFLSKENFQETRVGTNGKFGGVGIVISIRDAQLTVISPLDGTPAARAKIKAGDKIVKIDNEPTINMTLTEAVDMMRGPRGQIVRISIMRKGWEKPKEFKIKRDIIKIVSVESDLLPVKDKKIGYVRVKNFQSNTHADLMSHLNKLRKKAEGSIDGLILDLRNNPGGLLDQAIKITDTFIDEGTIVTTVGYRNQARKEELAKGKDTEPEYPMVILVNEGSASASEIVSGALKRQNRATILGQTTFGKGTVQTILGLPEESALKLTVAKYLTPGDISIQGTGISADIELRDVKIAPKEFDLFSNAPSFRESKLDHHFEKEDQLAKLEKPAYKIFDVTIEAEEEAEENTGDDEYSTQALPEADRVAKRLEDFPVSFAAKILSKHNVKTRRQMLSQVQKDIEETNQAQEAKLISSLKKFGIDWSNPNPSKVRRCEKPRFHVESLGINPKGIVKAGETVKLKVVATNAGSCDTHRFWIHTESKNHIFNQREYIFGKIKPGQRMEKVFEYELPVHLPTQFVQINLTPRSDEKDLKMAIDHYLAIQAEDLPKFSMAVQLEDRNPSNKKKDKDGIPSAGEHIQISGDLENLSTKASKATSVTLKSKIHSDIVLKTGRLKFEDLEKNHSRPFKLNFDIPQTKIDQSIRLFLNALDTDSRSFLLSQFDIKALDGTSKPLKNTSVYVGNAPIMVYLTPNHNALPIGQLETGSKVMAKRETENFYGIRGVDKQTIAWVKKSDVTNRPVASSSGKSKAFKPIRLSAPDIEIPNEEKLFSIQSTAFKNLDVEIQDRVGLKEAYVFVGTKKIHYQRFNKSDAGKATIQASLPLEEGMNRVTVFATNSLGLTEQRVFFLHRQKAEKTALAL